MKKIYKYMAVVAIVTAAGFTAYSTQSNKLHLSSLAIENVEALASDELYDIGIFDQDCSDCQTDLGSEGAFFYCMTGNSSCFATSCVAGYCDNRRR